MWCATARWPIRRAQIQVWPVSGPSSNCSRSAACTGDGHSDCWRQSLRRICPRRRAGRLASARSRGRTAECEPPWLERRGSGRWTSGGRFRHPHSAHRARVQWRSWHRHRHRCRIRVVIIGRGLVMSFCNRGSCLGFRRSPLRAVVVRQVHVPVEEKEVGVEQSAVPAKGPHEELHRPDIDQKTRVRPERRHRFRDYLTRSSRAPRARPPVTIGSTMHHGLLDRFSSRGVR